MAKYYLQSGDLKTVLSTSLDPKGACKFALEKFMDDNRNSKEKSVGTSISLSERGFIDPLSKIKYTESHTMRYDVVEILNLI